MVQEFGSVFAGLSWLRIYHQLVVKIWIGTVDIWKLDWNWVSALKLVPMHGWKVSAGCWWKASNIYHVNIPMGLLECPHNILAGFPRWIIPNRAQWKVQQPQRSHLIVTAISFGYTGQPYFCGRNLHRGVNIRRGASLRPYWSLVSTKRETQRGITAQQLILGFSGWNTGYEFLVTLWPLPGIKPWTLPHSKPPRILYAAAFQLSCVHWQHLN